MARTHQRPFHARETGQIVLVKWPLTSAKGAALRTRRVLSSAPVDITRRGQAPKCLQKPRPGDRRRAASSSTAPRRPCTPRQAWRRNSITSPPSTGVSIKAVLQQGQHFGALPRSSLLLKQNNDPAAVLQSTVVASPATHPLSQTTAMSRIPYMVTLL